MSLIINPEDLLNIDPNGDLAAYIFKLLMNCTLPNTKVREIEDALIDGRLKIDEANVIIGLLLDSQVDKIDAGHNYGQREIHEKLKRMGL